MQVGSATGAPGRGREEAEVEFSRIVAFSDGVFAIAMTLLVLNLNVPTSDLGESLREQRPDFIAYALSFAVLARFWLAHHTFFSEVRRFDRGLMLLNLLLLGLVVLVPFATGVFGAFEGDVGGIAVYAVLLAALAASEDLLAIYAVRAGLTTPEAAAREEAVGMWRFAVPALFLVAIPLAAVIGAWAPLVWLLMIPVGVALQRRGGSRLAKSSPPSA